MTSTVYRIGNPPRRLRNARLDNIALVPASLLPLKNTYQPLANKFPKGSVLCVPATTRQRTIVESVRKYFTEHGRTVITMPLEQITRRIPQPVKPPAETLQLAF